MKNRDDLKDYKPFAENDPRGTLSIAYPIGFLAAFVDYYWETCFSNINESFVYSRALPTFNTLLAFNLTQHTWQSTVDAGSAVSFRNSNVFGVLPRSCLCRYPIALRRIGVKLKPGALSCLLGRPADELLGLAEDIHYFLPAEALEDHLRQAATFTERVELVSTFLTKHFSKINIDYRYDVVQHAFRQFDSLCRQGNGVQQLAESSCLTPRTLNRYFQQFVGMNPKWCLRLHRFSSALAAHQHLPPVEAYSAFGYTDHSHFYKDAMELTGVPASQWFNQSG